MFHASFPKIDWVISVQTIDWNQYAAGTMMEALDMRIVEVSDSRVIVTMPVSSKTRQPAGLLHGGASVALAESAASIGSLYYAIPKGKHAVGMEINANHIRPKREGVVKAIATAVHKGKTTFVWDVRIVDEADRLICISRCTIAIVEAK